MTTLFKILIDDAKENAPDIYTELGLDDVEYDTISWFMDYATFEHPTLNIEYINVDIVEGVVDYLLNEYYTCDYTGVQATNVKRFAKKWELYTSDFRYIKANGVSHG